MCFENRRKNKEYFGICEISNSVWKFYTESHLSSLTFVKIFAAFLLNVCKNSTKVGPGGGGMIIWSDDRIRRDGANSFRSCRTSILSRKRKFARASRYKISIFSCFARGEGGWQGGEGSCMVSSVTSDKKLTGSAVVDHNEWIREQSGGGGRGRGTFNTTSYYYSTIKTPRNKELVHKYI